MAYVITQMIPLRDPVSVRPVRGRGPPRLNVPVMAYVGSRACPVALVVRRARVPSGKSRQARPPSDDGVEPAASRPLVSEVVRLRVIVSGLDQVPPSRPAEAAGAWTPRRAVVGSPHNWNTGVGGTVRLTDCTRQLVQTTIHQIPAPPGSLSVKSESLPRTYREKTVQPTFLKSGERLAIFGSHQRTTNLKLRLTPEIAKTRHARADPLP